MDVQAAEDGGMLELKLDSVDSCVHSSIPVLNGKDYNITIPDPGEYERGLTPEDDIILSVPAAREAEFYKGVEYQTGHGDRNAFYPTMKEEFARPPFYNTIFETWGLMTGAEWDKKKKLF